MIAVIGGSGFIGSRLCKLLQDSGTRFRILDLNVSPFFPEATTVADIRDYESLKSALVGCTAIVHLAAQHRDDVIPTSLYHDVNVTGTKNIARAASELGISTILFTSSVAVYGFAPKNTNETGQIRPFNRYGETKYQAEEELRAWFRERPGRSLLIVRPTVVFGERNRGNVYSLLKQISSGRFLMVGEGRNQKSMAYVGNLCMFLKFLLEDQKGYHLTNYIDKPDISTSELVSLVRGIMGKPPKVGIRLPIWIGYLGGGFFDILARITGRRFSISRVRVKKFVSDTLFDAPILAVLGFQAPYSLEEGLRRTISHEFLETHSGPVFLTE